MKRMTIPLALAVLLGLAALLLARWAPWQAKASQAYVLRPIETHRLPVQAGKVYPFPWVAAGACSERATPGCFVIRTVTPQRAVLAFAQFEVEAGSIKPTGFSYEVAVTPEGTPFELFRVKPGGEGEFWVYAALVATRGDRATIDFLRYPASVTREAVIDRQITLDLGRRLFRETSLIEAQQPVTMIGLRDLTGVVPGARVTAVTLNGAPVRFPYANIMNLNLAPGTHQLTVDVTWQGYDGPVCLGPIYEAKKMSLPRETDLRVIPGAKAGAGAATIWGTLQTFGLPLEVWQDFEPVLDLEPEPLAVREEGLSQWLQFPVAQEVHMRIRPIIRYADATFPVLVCVDQGAADGSPSLPRRGPAFIRP